MVRVEAREGRILPVPTMFSGWSTTARREPGEVDSVLCWCVSEVSPPNWSGPSLTPAARRNERATKSWGQPIRPKSHFWHFAPLSRLDSVESGPVLVWCVRHTTGATHSRHDQCQVAAGGGESAGHLTVQLFLDRLVLNFTGERRELTLCSHRGNVAWS